MAEEVSAAGSEAGGAAATAASDMLVLFSSLSADFAFPLGKIGGRGGGVACCEMEGEHENLAGFDDAQTRLHALPWKAPLPRMICTLASVSKLALTT